MKQIRTLILGGQGMLGQDVHHIFSNSIATSSKQCDITSPTSIEENIARYQPDLIINCAAYTKVDLAEKEREQAFSINATGAKNVAHACAKENISLIHISTDYVFDGTQEAPYSEQDSCHPLSIYGRSKHDGEKYILNLLPTAKIVRTQWLYGLGGGNFVETMLRLAQNRDTLSVIADQYGTPTNTADLARALHTLSSYSQGGIFHIRNAGSASWYEFACTIFEQNKTSCHVSAIPSSQYPLPAQRPQNSILGMERWTKELQQPMLPHWKEALRIYLQKRQP
jgi:dTDP-4-dehydrorhamnose reductase